MPQTILPNPEEPAKQASRRTREACASRYRGRVPPDTASRSAPMGEIPVELACPRIDGSGLEVALLDPGDRQDLAIISRREHLIGGEHLGKADAALMHGGAGIAQQLDDALAGDAGEKGAVGDRRVGD